ncbi:MAG: amidohydrolase family protein [Myxococcales bacterium]|nr:amidohydrolase family protein [Myxococcales bacterium]
MITSATRCKSPTRICIAAWLVALGCETTEGSGGGDDAESPNTDVHVEDVVELDEVTEAQDVVDDADGVAEDVAEDATSPDAGHEDTTNPLCTPGVDGCPALVEPSVVSVGEAGRLILRGKVVTPGAVFDGEVLVVGETIACADLSCSERPEAVGATIVNANGMIFPGLIDAHNHMLFGIFDLSDWPIEKTYDYHEEWADAPGYEAVRDAYDFMIESGQAALKCEVLKYGEVKALIAGTTAVVGQPKGTALKCFGSLARSLDGGFNDLPKLAAPPFDVPAPCTASASNDHIQTSFNPKVTASYATGMLENFAECKTWAWHVHAGEGEWDNPFAIEEFEIIKARGLDVMQTVIVHGNAFGTEQFEHMAERGMNLIWSPRCNVALHGQTVRIDLLKQVSGPPITVALGADWSLNGSTNLLDELAFADAHNAAEMGGVLSDADLVDMVTINAAKVLAVDEQLGSIEVGKMADLIIVSGDAADPYRALVRARPANIMMTMVGGIVLYGAPVLEPLMPPGCEPVAICGQSRVICVAEGSTADKLDQSLEQIQSALEAGLSQYDAVAGTDFMPLSPLVLCP